MSTTARRDLTQLPLQEQIRLLEELDRREKLEAGNARRRHCRYTFRTPRPTSIHVKSPEGTHRYFVLMRNISSTGCSILHSNFLYASSPCAVELHQISDDHPPALGVIRRCTLVKDWIHEVGIQFNEPVDVDAFVTEAERPAQPANNEDPVWVGGRKIATKLKAAIDSRDRTGCDFALQELINWRAKLPPSK